MKKLSYRIATISYCPDLTAPDAKPVPIAALLVSRDSDSRWTAFVMGFDVGQLGLDPLAGALLSDLPGLVRRTLDTAMKSIDPLEATPQRVLRGFHELLRTSVHVSHISEERELHTADGLEVSRELFDLTVKELLAAPQPTPATRPSPEIAPAHMLWHPTLRARLQA